MIVEKFHAAGIEGLGLAADWLAEVMRALVGIPCPAYHTGQGGHSAPGDPPFLESGTGQESIGSEHVEDGAKVGVGSIGTSNMIGGNYMAGWDAEPGIRDMGRRPWLSTWTDYKSLIDRIVSRHIEKKMGVRK